MSIKYRYINCGMSLEKYMQYIALFTIAMPYSSLHFILIALAAKYLLIPKFIPQIIFLCFANIILKCL